MCLKKAKLDEINADTATALQKTLNNQETINSINKMSAAQRKNLAGAAFNFMLGLMKDKELAQRGSGLVSGVSNNPMLAQAGQFERGCRFGQRPSQKWRQDRRWFGQYGQGRQYEDHADIHF